MSSLIEQVAKEAKATFSKDVNDPDFPNNFNKLVRYVGKLQASDIKLDESLQNANCYTLMSPCLGMDVFGCSAFTITVFILNPGVKMPLHDHPAMHGILKVIRGSVRISAYTSVADEPGDKAVPEDVRHKVGRCRRMNAVFIPAKKLEPKIVSEKDPPCVLRPKEANFHEISTVGDNMAVFLDVLAPPYDFIERKFTFYKALETSEKDSSIKTWLARTVPDDKYYSSSLDYCGPHIKL